MYFQQHFTAPLVKCESSCAHTQITHFRRHVRAASVRLYFLCITHITSAFYFFLSFHDILKSSLCSRSRFLRRTSLCTNQCVGLRAVAGCCLTFNLTRMHASAAQTYSCAPRPQKVNMKTTTASRRQLKSYLCGNAWKYT